MGSQAELMVMGRVGGAYGVHGWLRVRSDSSPANNILLYQPWLLERNQKRFELEVAESRLHGKGLVVKFEGCADRTDALAYVGSEILVPRGVLPKLGSDEYYWSDLIGLEVVTTAGVELGRVDHLLETGANDVLVIRGDGEHLIPFVFPDFINSVDLEQGRILVDWDSSF
jgi:16S rRNA processing protein RimM